MFLRGYASPHDPAQPTSGSSKGRPNSQHNAQSGASSPYEAISGALKDEASADGA